MKHPKKVKQLKGLVIYYPIKGLFNERAFIIWGESAWNRKQGLHENSRDMAKAFKATNE